MSEGAIARELVCGTPRLKMPGVSMFCPGCHYGTIGRLLCEVLEEMGIAGKAICVVSASCSFSHALQMAIDFMLAPHGRAAAVATAIKRVHPDAVVFTLQGDGDLGAIGLGHFMHAMLRGERLTTIFLNNAGYGMTGGQMAPTTLLGMRTTTTPAGRDCDTTGFPLHVAELAATMRGVAYSARCTVHTPANYRRAKKAVATAFQKQVDGVGYGLVEFLSACPTIWGMRPEESLEFVGGEMAAEYPLGEYKDAGGIW